jgi:hypothetical protein
MFSSHREKSNSDRVGLSDKRLSEGGTQAFDRLNYTSITENCMGFNGNFLIEQRNLLLTSQNVQ